jgi:hypothetical protein
LILKKVNQNNLGVFTRFLLPARCGINLFLLLSFGSSFVSDQDDIAQDANKKDAG